MGGGNIQGRDKAVLCFVGQLKSGHRPQKESYQRAKCDTDRQFVLMICSANYKTETILLAVCVVSKNGELGSEC